MKIREPGVYVISGPSGAGKSTLVHRLLAKRDNLACVSVDPAAREGKDLALDIGVEGARQSIKTLPNAVRIFILPPSRRILEARLRERCQDSEEAIEGRLRGAAEEVKNYSQYDYVLVNREIERSVAELEAIVTAERLRQVRMNNNEASSGNEAGKASRVAVYIISAPSGSGKSTLVHRLLANHDDMTFSISHTTRAPRGQEVNGVDYHFVSREAFEEMLRAGEFLEHAEVFGNYYGTNRGASIDRAAREGKDLVLDIDVQGARQLKVALPDAVSIFVLPPSRQVLEARLRARSQDSDEVIERRLRGAAGEVKNYGQYDYVLINQEIEHSVAELESIVTAERLRRVRMDAQVRPILESFEDPGKI